MIRRKHDLRQKQHIPLSIEYRGKADSANVPCSCGYVDLVAVWYTGEDLAKVTGVRDPGAWWSLIKAIAMYLASIHPPPRTP